MSDTLSWMNQHPVLLKHQTLREVMSKDQFTLHPGLLKFIPGSGLAEDFLRELASTDHCKEAVEFLAYAMHPRACIWWGILCFSSIVDEKVLAVQQKKNEEEEKRAEEEKQKMKTPPKPEPEKPYVPNPADVERVKKIHEFADKAEVLLKEKLPLLPPKAKEALGFIEETMKKELNLTFLQLPDEVRKYSSNSLKKPEPPPRDDALTKKVQAFAEKFNAKISEREASIGKFNTPPIPEAHTRIVCENAIRAAYAWLLAPDNQNTINALEAAKAAGTSVEADLAMAAYWSYGDLTPEGEEVIQTPPGLASSGIYSALLAMMLESKGVNTPPERAERFFKLGFEVAIGRNNWSKAAAEQVNPCDEIFSRLQCIS